MKNELALEMAKSTNCERTHTIEHAHTKYIIWIVAEIVFKCSHKISIPLYLTITSTGLFSFKSFKGGGVISSKGLIAFKDCFQTNKIAASGDSTETLHGKS